MSERFETEQHLHFELIASLWREREDWPFVSRESLHQELTDDADWNYEANDAVVLELAHAGIDSVLDAFAMSGPDETVWRKVCVEGDYGLDGYYRYQVERKGVVGYVRCQDLTDEETDALAAKLRAEADEAFRRAKALESWRRNWPSPQ